MGRAVLTALFGLALCLAGATVDTPSLYVPGVALVLLPWARSCGCALAAHGATVARMPGPQSVVEEQPYPLRVEVRSGVLPPPGGELLEPLLGWPVPVAGRWSRRLRINVRFSRRGRRVLEPELLVIRDPLGLYSSEVYGSAHDEVLVLPRVEPVTAPGSGGAGKGADAGLGAAPSLSGAAARRRGRRARDRRPARVPRGRARVAHPLAVRGAARRDAGAAARGGARLRAAGGAGPIESRR